jgi:hypothetical protein
LVERHAAGPGGSDIQPEQRGHPVTEEGLLAAQSPVHDLVCPDSILS